LIYSLLKKMEDIQKCIQALRDTYEEKKKVVPWQEILSLFSAVETLRSYDKDSNRKETRVKRVNNASNASEILLTKLNKIEEALRRIDF
jgi:sulfite reductase beta subunit-like hemoprotein